MYGLPNLNEWSGLIRGVIASVLAIVVGFGAIHESYVSITPNAPPVLLSILLGIVVGWAITYIELNNELRNEVDKLRWQLVGMSIISVIVVIVLNTSFSAKYPIMLLISSGFANLLSIVLIYLNRKIYT